MFESLADQLKGSSNEPAATRPIRWILNVLLVFGLVSLALLVPGPPLALAHAELVEAIPAPGAVLTQAPATIQLHFSRELNLNLSRITVWDDAQHDLALSPARVVPGDSSWLELDVKAIRGRYNVIWSAFSNSDGHIYRGSYFFTVEAATRSQASTTGLKFVPNLAQSDPAVAEIVAAVNQSHNHSDEPGDTLYLKSASPPANTQLAQPPTEVQLEFNEPLDSELSQIIVWDREQHLLHLDESHLDTANPSRMKVAVRPTSGIYIVIYTAIAANARANGRIESIAHGALVFEVDSANAIAPPVSQTDVSPTLLSQQRARYEVRLGLSELLNWLLLWIRDTALFLLIGSIFFHYLVWLPLMHRITSSQQTKLSLRLDPQERSEITPEKIRKCSRLVHKRWYYTVRLCLLVLMVSLPLQTAGHLLEVAEGDWTKAFGDNQVLFNLLFTTSYGWGLIGQFWLLCLLSWQFRAFGWANKSCKIAKRATNIFLLLEAASLAVLSAASGHLSSTGDGGNSSEAFLRGSLALLATSTHLLAGAVWLGGGLLYLGGVLLPTLTARKAKESCHPVLSEMLVAHCFERFAPFALGSVGLLILTGLYQAQLHLGNIDNLFNTAYGLTLIIKHFLVAAMLSLSAYHLLKLQPLLKKSHNLSGWDRIERLYRRLDLVLRLEAGWGLAVLLCAGGLASLPPPLF